MIITPDTRIIRPRRKILAAPPLAMGFANAVVGGMFNNFNPAQLSPAAWWSASSVTQGGGTVSAVADLSGNGHNLATTGTQATYTAADAVLNGQPSVHNNQTAAATGGGYSVTWSETAPLTIYWMGYKTSGTNQASPDIFATTNAGTGRMFLGTGANASQFRVNGSGNAALFTSLGPSTAMIVCATMDISTNACNVYVNSASTVAGTVNAGATIAGTVFSVINGQSTTNNGGAFGNVIVYPVIHTQPQRLSVMQWGAALYNVILS